MLGRLSEPESIDYARTGPGGTPTAEYLTPEEWQRIKQIAAEAWDTPEADREALIATRCDGDETLRSRVVALLRAACEASDLYEVPALTLPGGVAAISAVASAGSSVIGARIGPYRVVREL